MPPEHNGTITNRLRRLRFENSEMTQLALAEQVGVTRQTIIALEAGKYVPSLLLAFRLARAFGVGVEDVFDYAVSATKASKEKGSEDAIE
jgi:putative transcriptional regulator